MASDNEASCASDPNFAVICSFLECFGKSCGIVYPDIARLQEMLENSQEVPQQLVDLHIKLLRKTRKTVSSEKWERALVKFCHTYSNQDGWELERFGYKKARVAVKLRLLKVLLEAQFDLNQKFKNEVNKLAANELRVEPIGRDKSGLAYWCQLDEECNIRVYREDLDEENWELVAKDRDEVVDLISTLTNGEIESIPINEDSNSLEISEKPIIDTGQVTSPSLEEEEGAQENGTNTENSSDKESLKVRNENFEDENQNDEQNEDENIKSDITTVESSEQNLENASQGIEQNQVTESKCSNELELSKSVLKSHNGSIEAIQQPIKEESMVSQDVGSCKKIEPKPVLERKVEELAKASSIKTDVEEASPVKSIETPVITSPLKLVNINELKQSQEGKIVEAKSSIISPLSTTKKQNHTEDISESAMKSLEKLSNKSNFSFSPAEAVSGHSKLSVKPIDQLAANLVRIQSEKLEKPSGTKSLEKIAENLARSGGTLGNVNNGEDERISQDFSSRNPVDKSGNLRGHRGMDLSTSPRGWESANEQNRPVDFSGMDLSSRKFNKNMNLPSPGYRSQEFQHREMDLSTKKPPSKQDVPNLPYDARTVMLRNHAMVADLSKRQMPFTPYELSSTPYHNTSRMPAKEEHRLPSYAILPDPSKLAALRMGGGSVKRPKESDEAQTDVLKRLRTDMIPIRGSMDKRPMMSANWREEVGEAVEEPVMMVQGEGSGSDCDAVNPDIGEAIEEPVIFFYGEGSGAECGTGNPGDETSTDNKESNESKSEADSATTTLSPNRIITEDSLMNEVATQSIVANKSTIKLNRNFPQTSVSLKDNCEGIGSTQEKAKFKPTLGVQIIPKSASGTVKRLSRWDVGKPAEEKTECDSSIISNERDISPMQSTDEFQHQNKESNVSIVDEELCNSKSEHTISSCSEDKENEEKSESTIVETDVRNSASVGCDSSVLLCQPDTSNQLESYTASSEQSVNLASIKSNDENSSSDNTNLPESENIVNIDNEHKSSIASPPRFFFGPNCISYTSKSEEETKTQTNEAVSTTDECESDTLQYECVSSSKTIEDALAATSASEPTDESCKATSLSEVCENKGPSDDNAKENLESNVEAAPNPTINEMDDDASTEQEEKAMETGEDSQKEELPEEDSLKSPEKLESSIEVPELVSESMDVDSSASEDQANLTKQEEEALTTKLSETHLEAEIESETKSETKTATEPEIEPEVEPEVEPEIEPEIETEDLQITSESVDPRVAETSENLETMDIAETSNNDVESSTTVKESTESTSCVPTEKLPNDSEDASDNNASTDANEPFVSTSSSVVDSSEPRGNDDANNDNDESSQSQKADNVDSTVENNRDQEMKSDNFSEVNSQSTADEEQSTDIDMEKKGLAGGSDADSMSANFDRTSERIDSLSDVGTQDEGSEDSEEAKEKNAVDQYTVATVSDDSQCAESNHNFTVSSSLLDRKHDASSAVPVTSSSGEECVPDTLPQSEATAEAAAIEKCEDAVSEAYPTCDIPSTSPSPTSDVNKNIVSSVGFEEGTTEFPEDTSDNPSSCVDQDSNEEMVIDERVSESNESPKAAVDSVSVPETSQAEVLDVEVSQNDRNDVEIGRSTTVDLPSVDSEPPENTAADDAKEDLSTDMEPDSKPFDVTAGSDVEDEKLLGNTDADRETTVGEAEARSQVEECTPDESECSENQELEKTVPAACSGESVVQPMENEADTVESETTEIDKTSEVPKDSQHESGIEVSKSLVANYDSDSNDDVSDDVFEVDSAEASTVKNIPETFEEPSENEEAREKAFKESPESMEVDAALPSNADVEEQPAAKSLKDSQGCADLGNALTVEANESSEINEKNEVGFSEEKSFNSKLSEVRSAPEPIAAVASIVPETESSIREEVVYHFQPDNNRESKDYMNSPLNNLNSFVENTIRKVENEEKASSRNVDILYESKAEVVPICKEIDNLDNASAPMERKENFINHNRVDERVTSDQYQEMKDQFAKPINADSLTKVTVENEIFKEECKDDRFSEEVPIVQSLKKVKEDFSELDHGIPNEKKLKVDEDVDMTDQSVKSSVEFNAISAMPVKLDNEYKVDNLSVQKTEKVTILQSSSSIETLKNSIDDKLENLKALDEGKSKISSNELIAMSTAASENYYNDISSNLNEGPIIMTDTKKIKDDKYLEKGDRKKEASKRSGDTSVLEDMPPAKLKAPYIDSIEERLDITTAAPDKPLETDDTAGEATKVNETSSLEPNQVSEKLVTEELREVTASKDDVPKTEADSAVAKEPTEIQNVDVDPALSDDSMGVDNEDMFSAPVEEADPLACEDDETLKNVNDALSDVSPKLGLRVKSVSELVYEGWKLDGTEPPAKLSRKRRNSSHESISEDAAENQEGDEEAGGKRIKLRTKRLPDKQLRKTVEDSRASVSSEDEAGVEKLVPKAVVPELTEKHENEDNAVSAVATVLVGEKKVKGRPKGGRRRKKNRGSRRPKAAESQNAEAVDGQNSGNTSQEISAATSQKKRKKRKMVLGLEIGRDIAAEVQPGAEEPPVRQSRRIAQLKIKEEADRRRIEEEALSELKEKKENAEKKKRKKQKHESEEEAIIVKEPEKDRKSKKKRRKRKKKKMLSKFNESNPWQSSSGSSSDDENDNDEDEDDEDDIESEGSLLFKSDHEFSPESDLEKDQTTEPLRRARTAQKSQSDVEEADDEYACQKCGKADHPEWILLCDSCDKGWHCSCLRPALMLIPEGDWFCPPCQHNLLVVKLRESLKTFDQFTKRHENEILRKKRLAFVGISLDNVLQKNEAPESQKGSSQDEDDDDSDDDESSSSSSESSSGTTSTDESEPVYQLRERRCANTYKFNEYDDMINAAIQDEVEAVQGAGNQGRGKDIATIVNAEKEEAKAEALKMTEELEEDEKEEIEQKSEKDSDEEYKEEKDEDVEDEEYMQKEAARKMLARKKHRKLNSLDISSEDDPESDEDFKGTGSEEEEEEDDHVSSTDDSFTDIKRRNRKGDSRPVRRSTRARMTRYDEDFINDDSDESDRPKRKKSRSTWGDSDSEDSDNSWRQKKKKSRALPTSRQRPSSKSKTKKKKKRKRIIESDNLSDDDEEEPKIADSPFIPDVIEQEPPGDLEQEVANESLDICPPLLDNNEATPESLLAGNIPELADISAVSAVSAVSTVSAVTAMPVVPVVPDVDMQPVLQEEPVFQKKKKDTAGKKKTIRRKIIYGGLPDENRREEEEILSRRTRGRKINYQEVVASDSEEELKKALRKTGESEDEFVVNDGDDFNDDAEKDSDSGDIYNPKKDGPKFKNKAQKNRKQKKSPGAKRKSFCDDGTPKQRKKPGPKPGSKNKPRKSNLMISPVLNLNDIQDGRKDFNIHDLENPLGDVGSKFDESLPDNIGFSGTTISVAGSFTGDVPEGSLPGLGSGELEGLDEEQLEQMMMEDEEYGRRQLELAAIEIAKKKKKEEREAKKLEKARLKALEILAAERQRDSNALEGTDGEVPKKKKRGRRSKAEILAEQMRRDGAPALGASMLSPVTGMAMAPDMGSGMSANINPNMSSVLTPDMDRTPEGQLPLITGPDGQLFNSDGTPVKPKRRGRGKGKKTLALEAARAAEAAAKAAAEAGLLGMGTDSNPELKHNDIPNVLPTPGSSTSGSAPSTPPAIGATTQGQSATQPNSQSVYPSMPPGQQSSVITRMLQSQPVASSPQSFTAAAAAMGHKYFGAPNQTGGQIMPGPRTGYEMQPRGRIPSPYRQAGQSPMPPHFAAVRSGTPPMRMRVPGPQMYHTPHHPMDPSPSGGGPISINSRDRSSPLGHGPAMIPPAAGSPLAKGGPTPPPPPYVRGGPPISRFGESPLGPRHQMPPFTNASSVNHGLQQPSPPPNRPPGNFSPYHPPPPPNYHYGAYPPPPPMSTADDAAAYQGSPYPSEHFSSPGDNQPPPGIPQAPPPQQQPPPTTQQPQPAPPHPHPHPGEHPGPHTAPHPGPPHPGPHPGAHPGAHPGPHPGAGNKQYDEEGTGEFGGLVSYFSSQREDDLDS